MISCHIYIYIAVLLHHFNCIYVQGFWLDQVLAWPTDEKPHVDRLAFDVNVVIPILCSDILQNL